MLGVLRMTRKVKVTQGMLRGAMGAEGDTRDVEGGII